MNNLLENLNKNQCEAVVNTEGPSLIIAGAGSGKTKVLTHKIAYLMKENGVHPWNILAITFTNKAAKEMKTRIGGLVGEVANSMWIGTFHAVCLRILRKYIHYIGFDSSFIIFDTGDQKTLVKQCLKELNIDDKLYPDRAVLAEISNAKNELLEPENFFARSKGDFRKEKIASIYDLYQKRLKSNNALDFDDIINYTIKLLMEVPECLLEYSEQFKYVLVDEYQDTNKAQFTLITLLASRHGNITVVGDNDQGIYSFRGADIKNILNFEKDFPGTKIIKLEQNYRCTGNILTVANSVIKNNENKYKKELWTDNENGGLVHFHLANNEYEEANYIVETMNSLRREHYFKYSDFTVLYRTNAQSRAIEDILRREDIPYKIVGGLKFYERKEIKDIISYLRLIHNTSDNLSLKRIINEPKRGIGKTSLEQVEEIANVNEKSMYYIIKNSEKYSLNRVFVSSREFIQIIEELIQDKNDLKISEIIKQTLRKTGYVKALEQENTVEAESRIANLDEFLTVAVEFEEQFAENTLGDFLEGITLSSDLDSVDEAEETVTLMTLHSAKGLEFPVVFLAGMEDGIFPSYKSIGEVNGLEEERRLCYVGITRAKQFLHLISSRQRTIFGSTGCNPVSRFVKEIPADILDGSDVLAKKQSDVNPLRKEYVASGTAFNTLYKNHNSVQKPAYEYRTAESFLSSLTAKPTSSSDLSVYKPNTKIYHKKFGNGVINSVEAEGDDLKLDIVFEKVGNKRLMAKFAGLEII